MKTENTPIEKYVKRRSTKAIDFVHKVTDLLTDFQRMPKSSRKVVLLEMEMLMADATFGCDFGYCANLYDFDAVRGMYDACAGSDALSNEEIEQKYSPFAK